MVGSRLWGLYWRHISSTNLWRVLRAETNLVIELESADLPGWQHLVCCESWFNGMNQLSHREKSQQGEQSKIRIIDQSFKSILCTN